MGLLQGAESRILTHQDKVGERERQTEREVLLAVTIRHGKVMS